MRRVIGHDATRSQFMHAMQHERLHHAWLFTGPEGIGKASLAMELTSGYLCERNHDGGSYEACLACHACKMLAAGSHPDFLWVKRGLNKSSKKLKRDVTIDQVRELLLFLNLTGAESARRVVILEEGDRLNVHAANALLKGLEEPTPGSLLMLVCSDSTKLPATIRSRCMLAPLYPLSERDSQQVLMQMGLKAEALTLATELSRGQPGRLQCMQSEKTAAALLRWQEITAEVGRINIGDMESWLTSHAKEVPHNLIVDMVISSCESKFAKSQGFAMHSALMDAATVLAALPTQIAQQTLRAAPCLLAAIVQLRSCMLDVERVAESGAG